MLRSTAAQRRRTTASQLVPPFARPSERERRGTVTASVSSAPQVLEGLMQHDVPLALDHVLRRMRTVVGRGTVVTAGPDGARTTRATYADVAARCERVAGALAGLGIGPGDRVGTLQWNTQAHLEAYLAVPCMG